MFYFCSFIHLNLQFGSLQGGACHTTIQTKYLDSIKASMEPTTYKETLENRATIEMCAGLSTC